MKRMDLIFVVLIGVRLCIHECQKRGCQRNKIKAIGSSDSGLKPVAFWRTEQVQKVLALRGFEHQYVPANLSTMSCTNVLPIRAR